jgi:hypothetical protein
VLPDGLNLWVKLRHFSSLFPKEKLVKCLFNIQGYQLFNALLPFKDYSVFMDKDDIDFWEREKGGNFSFLIMILYFKE